MPDHAEEAERVIDIVAGAIVEQTGFALAIGTEVHEAVAAALRTAHARGRREAFEEAERCTDVAYPNREHLPVYLIDMDSPAAEEWHESGWWDCRQALQDALRSLATEEGRDGEA